MTLARTSFVLPILAVFLLAGCQQRAAAPTPRPAPTTAPNVTPSTFSMPEGSGCAGEVARFRAVIANDRDTGNANKGVADRALADIDRAAAACAAGRDGEARSVIASTKARFGYP